MKCPNCGNLNNEEDKFCKKCGTALNQDNNIKSDNSSSNTRTLIICATIIICVVICLGAFMYVNSNSNNNDITSVNESSNNRYSFEDYDVRIISGTTPSICNENPDYSYEEECNIITSTGQDDDCCLGSTNYVSTKIVDGSENNVKEVNVYTSYNVFVGKVEITVVDANGKSHKVTKEIDSTMQQSFDISVPTGCSIDEIHCYLHN